MAARPLSELEGCVLGHLFKHGPATAYAVRQAFLQSPSSHWSGSAGAVYPLLVRLEKLGLVESQRAARGRRQAWKYAVTRTGRRRFLAWLEPPFRPEVISTPPDPLRTRAHFLGALPPSRRDAFLDEAIEQMRRHLAVLADELTSDDDDCHALEGGMDVTRARIAWLEKLRGRAGRSARR